MVSNILWGLFLVLFVALMIFIDRRKQINKSHSPYREKTEQEKEVEREKEKAKSRRNGPPTGGGFGGGI